MAWGWMLLTRRNVTRGGVHNIRTTHNLCLRRAWGESPPGPMLSVFIVAAAHLLHFASSL
jgi:hypothetical protein